ncbi:PREDICTED: protein SOGA1 [Nanorana parkeri]|uniref:protein SOGA1 n=1 Tax=Nanorana parkeri TaxID=125878 RepID=UPI00085505E1|nr:PREDICTED: protein SOGA1 [Nanorana parkeri]
MQLSTSMAFSDLTEDILDGATEGLMREMEELRSENDYLKDEVEELRSEMLEMRDVYMEEDVYQLQELRQQLEQVHKTCRILQYRLKKSERRGLRVAQTGQVDCEFINTLEQDVKVAKDVSIRLHNELGGVEKKRAKLEEENEELRQRLIETDLAKQVLQNEMDKFKENSLKKRRSGKVEKKPPQEDNADLKCQLHFAKEESALMCKKLSKFAKDNDTMKEELMKYRSMHGDLDSSLSIDELANTSHSREAELKSHLKLVEEEANLLSRRMVELEVENRGLRAEMDEMKVHADRDHLGQDSRFSFLSGESGDSFVELRRHLQFVEEEADLLRRSMMELEDQNKLLMNELNKYKSDHDLDITLSEDSCSVISEPSQEELATAKMQISELGGKVKKLQYENRVLLSNLQRYDLASCQTTKPFMETDAEAGDSAQCVPTPLWREGPIGGEMDSTDSKECTGKGTVKSPETCHTSPSRLPKIKELESLFGIRTQVELISKAIEVLTSYANGFPSGIKLCTNNDCRDLLLTEAIDNSEVTSNSKLISAIFSRLGVLQQELNSFTKKVDALGEPYKGLQDSSLPLPDSTYQGTTNDSSKKEHISSLQQPECRNCREKETSGWEKMDGDHSTDHVRGYNTYQPEDNESFAAEIQDLQLVLSEANETIQGLQEQLSQERQLRKEDEEAFNQKIVQLKEDQQKLLLRRDFELQSLGLERRLEQKFWSQEKNILVQEVQQFKQSFFLTFMKLRWFLQRWRKGKVLPSEGEDFLEVNCVKELYMLIEEEELNGPCTDYKACEGESWPQNMTIESMKTVSDVKRILKDLCNELQEERRGMNELQQQFARAKAAWEIERTELKLECGKHGIDRNSTDIKAALKREREEHQHLLAESYSAVMDLTKQLQVSEKNWGQEKEELLARFQEERKKTEEQVTELQGKLKQKEGETWVRGPERKSSCWKEALNDNMQDKDIDCDMDANGSGLKRTKSVSSVLEFESLLDSSPYVPGKLPSNYEESKGMNGVLDSQHLVNGSIEPDLGQNCCAYVNDKSSSEHSAKDRLGISSWDYTMDKTGNNRESGHKQIQRSHTAPDRTGIRIYYSPPVVRKLDAPLIHNKEKIMVEPGFLFTMAKPKESENSECMSGNSYSQWLCNFSKKQRDLLDKDSTEDLSSVPAFPSPLGELEISGNMSDDMKEITNCVRQAIRSSSLERKTKSTSSQTVCTIGVQTIRMVNIGLQTDLPRTSLHTKSWSPRSSLLSARTKHISTSLDKVHSRVERPCCSPKYGSPKLQRRSSSSKLDHSKDRSLWSLHQNKQNGSAWARSTTTRDSPVLTNVYDGSSSLFNVVDHAGSTESLYKAGLAEGRNKGEASKYGVVQEFFRNVCGRSAQAPSTGTEKKEVEDGSKRPDNHDQCSSAMCHPSHNVSKLLSKRTSLGGKDGSPKDPDITSTSATEDYACNCSSHPVTSCFSRPSRTHSRQSHSKCQLHQEPGLEDKTASGSN